MQVLLAPTNEEIEERKRRKISILILSGSNGSHRFNNLLSLINRKKIRNFTRIQKIIDILEKRLLFNLRISEKKHGRFAVFPRRFKRRFDVFLPLDGAVALRNLRLKNVKIGDVSGETTQRLPAGSADADEKRVAAGLLQNATNTNKMFKDISKGRKIEKNALRRGIFLPEYD